MRLVLGLGSLWPNVRAPRPDPSRSRPVASRPSSSASSAPRSTAAGTTCGAWCSSSPVSSTALAIYFDLGGPLGRFIDDASGLFVGLLRVLMPPALIGCGVLLIRSGGDKEREGDDFRTIAGAVVVLVALAGFCHLFGGQPSLNADDRVDNLCDAGGLLGRRRRGAPRSRSRGPSAPRSCSRPSRSSVRCMFIGIPVRDAVGIVRRCLAAIGGAAQSATQSLFTLGRDRQRERRTRRRGDRPPRSSPGCDDAIRPRGR